MSMKGGPSQNTETNEREWGTHFLGSTKVGSSQKADKKGWKRRHPLPEERRGRVKLGELSTYKEMKRTRGTHELESAEKVTNQDSERKQATKVQGALTY